MIRHRLYGLIDRIQSIDQLCIALLFRRSTIEIDGIGYVLQRPTSQWMLCFLWNNI